MSDPIHDMGGPGGRYKLHDGSMDDDAYEEAHTFAGVPVDEEHWEDGEIKFPGLDDCEYLTVLSSEDGEDAVYIKILEVSEGKFFGMALIDCGTENWTEDYGDIEGPHNSPKEVEEGLLYYCMDWFMDNEISLAEITNWNGPVKF